MMGFNGNLDLSISRGLFHNIGIDERQTKTMKQDPPGITTLERSSKHRNSRQSRKNNKRTKNKKRKQNIWLPLLIAVVCIGAGGFIFWKQLAWLGFHYFVSPAAEDTIQRSYVPLKEDPPREQTIENRLNAPFSLLLLGTDQRNNENGLSDSIIYTVIRPKENRALFISIPRDSYTEIIGAENVKGARTQTKINAAHSYGGPQMAVDTVEHLLDAPIHYYAAINFNGLVEVVNALGGVELPVTKLIENKNPLHEKLRVEPNKPIYSGEEALMYVRYREDSDFNRTERQRIFLKAVLKRMQTFDNLKNISNIMELAGTNLKTNMNADLILGLAEKVILKGEVPQITSRMLKGEGKKRGQWYYMLDETDVRNTHDIIATWLDSGASEEELKAAAIGASRE